MGLRIIYLASAVYAPQCLLVTLEDALNEDPYLELTSKSEYLGLIEAISPEGVPSQFDVFKLSPHTRIPSLFGAALKPHTDKAQWRFWMSFVSLNNRQAYVVTESKSSTIPGRLVGFALVTKESDKKFVLDFLEIDKVHRRKGIAMQLTTKLFRIFHSQKAIFNLENSVTPSTAGEKLYVKSAQEAGYKFVHIVQKPHGKFSAFPLTDGLDALRDVDWHFSQRRNYFFTMGKHALYRLYPVETVNQLHLICMGTSISCAPPLEIPHEWKAVIDSNTEFAGYFAFAPHATEEALGSVLLKVRAQTNKVESFYTRDPDYPELLPTLLEVVFANSQQPSIAFEMWMFLDLSPVLAAAKKHGYSDGVSSGDDMIFTRLEVAT